MFDVTWQDIYVILTHSCTHEEKNPIRSGAQEFADELAARDRDRYAVGGAAVPNTGPHWNDAARERERGNSKITCLIEGMKKDSRPGSFVKIQEVPQVADENPALFQGGLVAAISKIYKSRPNIA